MDAAAECAPIRGSRRGRFIRVYSRRKWRNVGDVAEGLMLRAETLVENLMERVREKTRPTAPAPDPAAPRPTPEEWAGWADENLSPEDAHVFRSADSDRAERV